MQLTLNFLSLAERRSITLLLYELRGTVMRVEHQARNCYAIEFYLLRGEFIDAGSESLSRLRGSKHEGSNQRLTHSKLLIRSHTHAHTWSLGECGAGNLYKLQRGKSPSFDHHYLLSSSYSYPNRKTPPDQQFVLLFKMKFTLLLASLGAMTAMAATIQQRQNDLPHCVDGEGTVEGIWQDRTWLLNAFSVRTHCFE